MMMIEKYKMVGIGENDYGRVKFRMVAKSQHLGVQQH